MTKTKKTILLGLGLVFGLTFIINIIILSLGLGSGEKEQGAKYQFTPDSLIVLSDTDTLEISNGELLLRTPKMTSAFFSVQLKEPMITANADGQLTPSLNGVTSTSVAFTSYKDSLSVCRVLQFGGITLSKNSYTLKNCTHYLNRVSKNVPCEKLEDVDLALYITNLSLQVDGNKRTYEFDESMGNVYYTLLNHIFGETVFELQ